jgi:radical SAM superfamily enzyme YgiQ (UPF0313 family)
MSNKNTLVLAYPNQLWYKDDFQTNWDLNPSTLCLLGAMVEDEVNVVIVDAQFYNMSLTEFVDNILSVQPAYIGISILSTEYKETLHIAVQALREHLPDAVVIAGGVHATIEYMDVIADPGIDFVVRGNGEYVLRDLLRYLDGRQEGMPTVGLVFRDGGSIVAQDKAVVEDMDSLPMPSYELVRMEDYVMRGSRSGPQRPPEFPFVRMVITRGCPVGCSFCQVEEISGKRVRSPSATKVIDELIYLRDRYGIRSYLIDDDNIVIKKAFFKEVLRQSIDQNLGLKFLINAFAIFKLDDEMLDLMKRAGCVGINVAIESGNQRVMNEIVLKPLELDRVKPLIKQIQDAGMFVISNFIIGFPGETWTEIRETIEFAERSGSDYVKIFVAVPLKGTRMWDIAVDIGAISDGEGGARMDWRFSQITSEEWTAEDISVLRAYEWDRINFASPEKRRKQTELWGISESEMQRIRKQTRDAVSSAIISTEQVAARSSGAITPARKWADPGPNREMIAKRAPLGSADNSGTTLVSGDEPGSSTPTPVSITLRPGRAGGAG